MSGGAREVFATRSTKKSLDGAAVGGAEEESVSDNACDFWTDVRATGAGSIGAARDHGPKRYKKQAKTA
jgi:hypothetical protein